MSPALHPLPRLLHPAAWWLWGVGLAVAASRTLNPFLLLLIVAVATWVVLERRELGSSNALVAFLVIGLVAIGLRIVMVTLLGGGVTGRVVLVRLPEVPLPDWTSGVRIGGPVTLEGTLFAVYQGLQLATILACLGAVNALASPRRLLRYVPATLYEIGTAVVVALTFAPQLVEDAQRVRTARRLRGHSSRSLAELGRIAVPVLVGALERSLDLAASMESRGYGRAVRRTARSTRLAGVLTLVGVGGVVVGLYGLLDGTSPLLLGMPTLALGVACAAAALLVGARRDPRTHYRRDPWGLSEWLVAAAGVVPAVVMIVAGTRHWDGIVPQQVPVELPAVPLVLVAAILVGATAAWTAPVPPLLARSRVARTTSAQRELVAS
ncbi:MAG: energy-coupling factor transporter transmembrane protein EcfT [Nocardioidaceae bacterium]|nr:energy-coupling factor transporter transmembrane protein EcfT [Nocardioidaceae bacterium]